MSNFKNIVGNESVAKRLELLCSTNTLGHLLLFCGIKGVGKRLFAEGLAKLWLNTPDDAFPADLHCATPEGKSGMHSIQAVRRLIDQVNLAPFSSDRKVFIIDDAERMLPTSSNALLKTLEEPPKNTLIILVTSAPDRLLGTIVSRSQTVRFCPLTDEQVVQVLVENKNIPSEQAQLLAKSSHGSVAHALKLLHQNGTALEQTLYSHFAQKRQFHEIANVAKEFQKTLDLKRKTQESELKSQFAATLKETTPAIRQAIEQEIEGVISLGVMQEVNELFFIVQAFFLDLERQSASLPLHFEAQKQVLIQALSTGRRVPSERVAKSIQQAKLAIERSSPIANVLESLLLQLN